MTVVELVKLIADNGFMLICAAIILYIFLRNERRRNIKEDQAVKQKIKDDESREKQYNMILGKLFDKFNDCANKKPEIHSPEEDEFQEKVNDSIDDVLKKLRDSVDADRCRLVRYHNGNYDLAGNPANKMSATNEIVREGLTRFSQNFQNQFRSVFSPWCTIIREQGHISVPDIYADAVPELIPLKEYFQSRGLHNVFGHAVYDKNQYTIGYIIVENANIESVPISQIESCLNDKANKVSALLVLKQNLQES